MQRTKFTVFLAALALGAATSAGAQTVIQAAPDTPPPTSVDTLVVIPPTATPTPDPAANAKCQQVMPVDYWDCMNSHNGGQ
ncbi:MAG TPA: hypothetical protein VMU79_09380 [Casimicrobiaceae bacterium]|jgi:hypothetical protein|nr:hypothetical protein [Casimicrobiaceae bacterium]